MLDSPVQSSPSTLWPQSSHPTGPVYRVLLKLLEKDAPRLLAEREVQKNRISFRCSIVRGDGSVGEPVRVHSIINLSRVDKWVEVDEERTAKEHPDTTAFRITPTGREAVVQVRAFEVWHKEPTRRVSEILTEERKKVGLPTE